MTRLLCDGTGCSTQIDKSQHRNSGWTVVTTYPLHEEDGVDPKRRVLCRVCSRRLEVNFGA